jgi:O-antigen/teichoic acid export membrane protein
MVGFASGNYIGSIFGLLPASLLPLIITSRLGAQNAAYFYMPLMIIALINIIPSANAQSLFAEASNDEHGLPNQLRRAFKQLILFLIPAVLTAIFFGYFILGFFGHEYAETGTRVLQILAIASFVGSFNYFGDTLLNIKRRSGLFIAMNALNALTIVILSYITAPYGLTAVATAWLIGQVVTLLIYFIVNWRLLSELWYSHNPQLSIG